MLEIAIFHRNAHEQFALDGGKVVFRDGELNERSISPDFASALGAVQFELLRVPRCRSDRSNSSDVNSVEPVDCIRITNQGSDLSLPWQDTILSRHQSTTLRLPVQIRRGQATFEIRDSDVILQSGRSFETISRSRGDDGKPVVDANLLGQSPGPATLSGWLQALGDLQRTASGSQALLEKTARAVCEPGGMNGAMLILRDEKEWRIAASHILDPRLGVAFNRELVEQVTKHGQTHYHDATADLATSSRIGADSIIAAPVFAADDDVVGIVYGIRSLRGDNLRRGVRPLEALWIQLLAESVSGSLLRMQAESEAARNRVMLEQAFNGKVVEQLLNDPGILESRDREVTALFADLRGYSRISSELGPESTHRLLSEILEHLTQCIQAEDGVIIDYYGDGLAAMWNAPTDQPDHPVLACRAALAMQDGLNMISERWKLKIQNPLRLGIGINTGVAQVGNSGTKTRLKYGPRGDVVVVASRLESATRRTQAKTLVSNATRRRLPSTVVTQRICRGALPGLKAPLDLYELVSLGDRHLEASVLARIEGYERALELAEAGRYDQADAVLKSIDCNDRDGLPIHFLANHVDRRETSRDGPSVFDLTTIKH